jgi:hypothetical protein
MDQDLKSQIKELERSLPPLPQEQVQLLERAAEELALSGITQRVLKAGDEAPDFMLPNAVGRPISLNAVLQKGRAVVTFYRGVW